jgi:hypothetical protein
MCQITGKTCARSLEKHVRDHLKNAQDHLKNAQDDWKPRAQKAHKSGRKGLHRNRLTGRTGLLGY